MEGKDRGDGEVGVGEMEGKDRGRRGGDGGE